MPRRPLGRPMGGLVLAPIPTTEAEDYWRVFLSGRTDVPTRSLSAHLERFLSLPPEEQRVHLAIRREGRIVGTVRLLPGTISGFSMDPAFSDEIPAAILRSVDLLRSRGAGAITASYEDTYARAFEALGFSPLFARMRMEAPTGKAPSAPAIPLRHPEEPEVLELPAFLRAVYEGHMEQQHGMHVGTEEDWRGYVTGLLRGESGRFMPDASFVALEGPRLVGAILVTHWMDRPLIAELGVSRDARRRGVGRALVLAASGRLADLGEASWALYVTMGNDPAIRLYESLGFRQIGGRTVTARLASPDDPSRG